MSTYQTAIDNARLLLNDAGKVRYPDAVCLIHAGNGVREVAYHRPDLFMVTKALACIPNQVLQTVTTASPVGLYVVDVQAVLGGNSISKADLNTLARYRRSWRTDTAAAADNWSPVSDDQTKKPQPEFYIYPRAPSGQQVIVQYVYDPLNATTPALGDTIPLADQLVPAIEAYIIFRSEMVDDEHVITQRAQAAYANFATIIGVSEKSRKMIVQENKSQ